MYDLRINHFNTRSGEFEDTLIENVVDHYYIPMESELLVKFIPNLEYDGNNIYKARNIKDKLFTHGFVTERIEKMILYNDETMTIKRCEHITTTYNKISRRWKK